MPPPRKTLLNKVLCNFFSGCELKKHYVFFHRLQSVLNFSVRQSRNSGFTLAEVLITLGIIGIVSALTMPVLINKYNERVTVTKVKKFYSTMSQAVQRISVDNGMPVEWDFESYLNGGSFMLYEYFKPYLKVAKVCVENSKNNCLAKDGIYLNGSTWYTSPCSYYNGKLYVNFMLNDGSTVLLRTYFTKAKCGEEDNDILNTGDICAIFYYDVNGVKAPNQIGRDIFHFKLTKNRFMWHGKDDCYLNDTGYGCSAWIIKHDNMNYPKTKTYASTEK